MQAESIYAMDFFTVDTIFYQRYYIHFIIHHKTREIIQFAITKNPVREFVRQQIIEFENSINSIVTSAFRKDMILNVMELLWIIRNFAGALLYPYNFGVSYCYKFS